MPSGTNRGCFREHSARGSGWHWHCIVGPVCFISSTPKVFSMALIAHSSHHSPAANSLSWRDHKLWVRHNGCKVCYGGRRVGCLMKFVHICRCRSDSGMTADAHTRSGRAHAGIRACAALGAPSPRDLRRRASLSVMKNFFPVLGK